MKRLFLLIIFFTLVGCSTSDEETSQEQEPEKNEEAEKESVESDTGELEDNNSEKEAIPNKEDTHFDISDERVQKQLFDLDNAKSTTLTFPQEVIQKGMTQLEVQEKYGKFDFIYSDQEELLAIYGNLAVEYSKHAPYGTDDSLARKDIEPNENRVEDVFYYANLPYEEVVSVFGEPDNDIFEIRQPSLPDPVMEYQLEVTEDYKTVAFFTLDENEYGESIVGVLHIQEETESQDNDLSDDEKENVTENNK